MVYAIQMPIGDVTNYYGGLSVKKEWHKFFWSIEDYDGNHWEEIPDFLYDALIKYEEGRSRGKNL